MFCVLLLVGAQWLGLFIAIVIGSSVHLQLLLTADQLQLLAHMAHGRALLILVTGGTVLF